MPQLAATFSRGLRLLSGRQFREVFNNRRPNHGKYFCIYTVSNSQSFPRMGLAVSKKVNKRAVERNRIKRQIRESFRLNQQKLGGQDFVVVAKSRSSSEENQVLRDELNRLWHKVRQKCEN